MGIFECLPCPLWSSRRTPQPKEHIITTPTDSTSSEICAELESRYRAQFNPPAGFRLSLTPWDIRELELDPTNCGDWQGPSFDGQGWKVTTQWTLESGVTFNVDGDGGDALSVGEAVRVAEALRSVAALVNT